MKKLIIICLITPLILPGCAPSYRFVKTLDSGSGYTVKKGPAPMPYFTIDTSGKYSEDKRLAKKRFKRRKKVVQKYYKQRDPEVYENNFLSVLKIFPTMLMYPLWMLKTIYQDSRPVELQERKSIDQYRKELEEIKHYIQEDCSQEEVLL